MIMIGVRELNQKHTGDNIKKWLLEIIEEWRILIDSTVVVVSDNANNMLKGITDAFGKEKQLSCYAHTLNLVPSKIIEEGVIVSTLCKKIKAIVTYFKKSIILAD